MKTKAFFTLLVLFVLALTLRASPSQAQSPAPQGEASAQAALGTAFTYQGQLKKDGNPVNATCDFQFSLWNALSAGSQIGTTQTSTNVPVSNGLFTVLIDFGAGVFRGDARWLQIAVRCPAGSGDYAPLSPRQALTPTPYALALPGLWTRQHVTSPNLIGGYSGNSVTVGVAGAAIAGGGANGNINRVTDNYGTVGGGLNNQAGDNAGTVDDKPYATVGGGKNNTASGYDATIGGGESNAASGTAATIGGGTYNSAAATYATIAGGGPSVPASPSTTNNRVTDDYGTIGGGGGNRAGNSDSDTANATYATVSGGQNNTASDAHATIGGGNGNTASDNGATIGGGRYNTASADDATVGGGKSNTASGQAAAIGGGESNVASHTHATVPGGYNNIASGYAATVGGGRSNAASDSFATVGGGTANAASRQYTTVSGGQSNAASGTYATVGGGWGNIAGSYAATVPGGYNNTAQGDYSFAAGRRAKANNQGCFVWGDSTDADVNCNTNNRWVARAAGGVYFYTNRDLTSGAYLAAGGSSWNVVSNRALKENFATVDTRQLLARVAAMPITTWNYKAQDASVRHIGPMAEDFNALVEGLGGEGKDYINSLDADGVAFASIQGLYSLVQEQDVRIAQLERENMALRSRLDSLEARVAALEQASASAGILGAAWPALGGLAFLGGAAYWRRKERGGQ